MNIQNSTGEETAPCLTPFCTLKVFEKALPNLISNYSLRFAADFFEFFIEKILLILTLIY